MTRKSVEKVMFKSDLVSTYLIKIQNKDTRSDKSIYLRHLHTEMIFRKIIFYITVSEQKLHYLNFCFRLYKCYCQYLKDI